WMGGANPAMTERLSRKIKMNRRAVISLLGAAAVWPRPARAPQSGRVRRVGGPLPVGGSRADGEAGFAAVWGGPQQLGWNDGRNVRLDVRWTAGDTDRIRRYAAELVAPAPDVILAYTSPAVAALQQATRTVPIAFAGVVDPVGAGFVESMARPGGNATG